MIIWLVIVLALVAAGVAIVTNPCLFGIHTKAVTGGGLMGDSLRCLRCGQDKYPEVFSGVVLRVVEPWEENEAILADERSYESGVFCRIKHSVVKKLMPHPTIECRFSIDESHPSWKGAHAGWTMHGRRPAVWRKDMKYPVCASCMIEDPFE
jgi:hypothetical protein